MNIRFRFFLPLIVFLIIFIGQVVSYSSGPPPGNAGAPGNNTCASAGCHNSFGLNTGSGELSLETNIPVSGFSPGETYAITVKIKQAGSPIFGFQSLLFGEEVQTGVGTVVITDATRTRTISSSGSTYAEQTKAGSASVDSAIWSFDWVAPEKGTGDVTLYTAALAANGNGNRQGDRVYTTNFQFFENLTASLEELSEIAEANLYPNPTTDFLTLNLSLVESTPIQWTISDLQGRTWQQGETSTLTSGWNTRFDLTVLPAGLYQLEIKTNSGRWREKIIKR